MGEITIPVKSLSSVRQAYDYHVNEDFTSAFGDNGILRADCDIHIEAEKKDDWGKAVCRIDGEVDVQCDRCLDPLTLPVTVEETLSVRFGTMSEGIEEEDDVVWVEEGESVVDLSQCVYDFICLSMPLQKVHPEGKCNPEMTSRIGGKKEADGEKDSPFGGLRELLNKNITIKK